MAVEGAKPVRVFINNVDEYQGYQIAKFLSQCVVGSSQEENEEEETEGSIASGEIPLKPKEGCYEIHGTLRNPDAQKPEFVQEILSYETKEQTYEHLVECEIIIFDISQDPDQIEEAMWAMTLLHQDVEKLETQRVFILISSVMTWAKSKPADEDDHETPLTDEDYNKRKPHPNYKEHLAVEKAAVKFGKAKRGKLATYVVAAGLTYGCGENILHSFFKSAWHNAYSLPIYGNGENILPMIHIRDLAAIIRNIADSRPKIKYLLAVDDSQGQTLGSVVTAVARGLSSGRVRTVTKEEAALAKDIDQASLDQLMVSLRLDAMFAKENFQINWVSESGLVENIDKVIQEFRSERGLQPIRVCLLGPPASGKTTIAKQICAAYKLHHIHIKDVIDEGIANLQRRVAQSDEEEGDESKPAEGNAKFLKDVTENMNENSGRIDDINVISFFRERLLSKPCQNQGFVLDGFPKNKQLAQDLFGSNEEDENEEDESSEANTLWPHHLFLLEASDEFLKRRVMQLPEPVVAGTHNTEEGLLRRLSDYRAANTDDESVMAFFDEKEIHPDSYDVDRDTSDMHSGIVAKMRREIGRPRNYGLTEEEVFELRKSEEEQRIVRERSQREERERREKGEAEERKRRQEEWAAHLEEVKREEHELLELRSEPLRNYLMKNVMPNLTKGLMECARVRPEDAVDYLAEYLFRNNPEIQ